MTVELGILIALIGCAVGIAGWVRTQRHDSRNDATTMTTVIVKLEGIGTSLAEIKSELGAMQTEVKGQLERLAVVERDVKSAWKRIEQLEKKEG